MAGLWPKAKLSTPGSGENRKWHRGRWCQAWKTTTNSDLRAQVPQKPLHPGGDPGCLAPNALIPRNRPLLAFLSQFCSPGPGSTPGRSPASELTSWPRPQAQTPPMAPPPGARPRPRPRFSSRTVHSLPPRAGPRWRKRGQARAAGRRETPAAARGRAPPGRSSMARLLLLLLLVLIAQAADPKPSSGTVGRGPAETGGREEAAPAGKPRREGPRRSRPGRSVLGRLGAPSATGAAVGEGDPGFCGLHTFLSSLSLTAAAAAKEQGTPLRPLVLLIHSK